MGADRTAGGVAVRWKASPDRIALRRGDQALLLDGAALRPLHVRRGAELVLRVAALEEDPGAHPALAEMLLEHGILRRPDGAPPRPAPRLPRGSPFPAPRMSLYLLVTHACNLACVYCFNGERTYERDRPPRMERGTAEAAVRWAMARLARGGELELVFFGGEPLLRWPLVRWVVERGEAEWRALRPDVRLRYHVTSNLTRLPRDLPDVARAVGMTFLCDVDGPRAVQDELRPRRSGRSSHAATVRAIGELRRAGLRVALRATITSRNAGDLPAVVEHHAALGGASSALVPLNPVSSDRVAVRSSLLAPADELARGLGAAFDAGRFRPEELHPFSEAVGRVRRREPRRIACGAPFGCTPTVDARGDVYPCIYFVGIPELRMDNVHAPEPERAAQVLDRVLHQVDVDADERCRSCPLRYVCAGGCPAMLVLTSDRPALDGMREYARSASCAVARTVTERLLWLEAEGRSPARRSDRSAG
ncbi:MAG: radical SAM protein [Deltaproteobacteria bacterium]|nr:radical SAM protein [Deltaproteobacteria bacterium]